MKVREVEFVGFKSFVDKTRFIFDKNITGVVGPNGCGKSNIVDAIKWVLGEKSAKSLRGDTMEDVIFNGTDTRKPLSMAQVSLIFSTEDGITPPGFELFDSIEITRRLYRSGESEYLINKQAARLKDIQELLMDTGLGAKAYSIVEQGQVSRVISSKPEERRLLIEEAAGITKFRVKKEEALRKVERTMSDLDRVQDVVAEIKRQMVSLARQASKARRYKEVKSELRQVDLELAARDHKRFASSEQKLIQEIDRIEQAKSKTQNNLDTGEAELSASQLQLAEHQSKVENARRELARVNEAIRSFENKRSLMTRDIENETAKSKTFEEETIRSQERIVTFEESAQRDDAQAKQLTEEADKKTEELQFLTAKLKKERELLAVKSEDTSQVRTRQVELVQKLAKLESRVGGWGERRLDHQTRSEDLNGKHAKNTERLLGLTDRLSGMRIRHAELLEKRKTQTALLTDKKNRLGSLREQLHRQRENFEQAQKTYQEHSVRLSSLTEMKRGMEGYREGVKNILSAARENETGGSVQGVLGIVADMMNVPERLEPALEAVLGERLQSVVVEDLDSGVSAADFLRASGTGRGSFVPKAPKRSEYTEYPTHSLASSDGPLIDMLTFDKEAEPVVRHLLDGILVVEDLPQAVDLHRANGYKGAFVTPHGELVDPHGVITGGSPEGLSSGILQMKREIDELSENVGGSEKAYKTSEDIYLRSEGLIATQEISVRDLTRKLDEIGLEIRETESEVQRSENELTQLEESQEEIRAHIAGIAEMVQRGDEEIEVKSVDLAKFKSELDTVREALGQSERGTRDISLRIDGLNESVTALSSETSANRERALAAADRAKTARQGIEDAKEQIDRLGQRIEQSKKVRKNCKEQIEIIVAQIEKQVAEAEEKSKLEIMAREALEAFVLSVREKEESLKLLRKDIDGVTQRISEMKVKGVEFKLKRENLSSQILDKYNEELVDLVDEYGESEIDSAALKSRQSELNRSLRGLGEVNLTAIEEHDEAKKRYDFYQEQQEDLLNAIDNLKEAILKINKESRERFSTTFTAVAAKFAEVIPMLFGGGKAQLSLTETNDILDAGVEIHIRPPGKKLQNMNLLSGGEKALAAIGLLFSIFLIKPSPFCLLDEVDAPLDDANIHRFNSLLEQIAATSQVILITHNKRTMEKADELYGVTMQEKGVSKLVSVRLSDIEDPAHAQA